MQAGLLAKCVNQLFKTPLVNKYKRNACKTALLPALKSVLVVFIVLLIAGCSENSEGNLGKTRTIKLKPNEKLLQMTWKRNQLWVLTIDTIKQEYHFREHSNWGIREDEVIIEKYK
ncbi:MAG: hypothetical protein ACOVNR_06655 [Chitinophagaceae bacterium]